MRTAARFGVRAIGTTIITTITTGIIITATIITGTTTGIVTDAGMPLCRACGVRTGPAAGLLTEARRSFLDER